MKMWFSLKTPQVNSFTSHDLELASYFRQGIQSTYLRSITDILPPSLSAHGSLWSEIPCYTQFGFTATNCGEQRVASYRGLYLVAELKRFNAAIIKACPWARSWAITLCLAGYRCKTRFLNFHVNAVPVSILFSEWKFLDIFFCRNSVSIPCLSYPSHVYIGL
jgi:hypothetical protein